MDGRVRRMVGVNLALLGVLVLVTLGPGAPGQGAQRNGQPAGRGRGQYTMVSGQIQGGTTDSVFILDAANEELVSLRWDRSGNRLVGIGYRDMRRDVGVEPVGR